MTDFGRIDIRGEVRSYACLRDEIQDLSDITVRTMLGMLLNSLFRGRPEASEIGMKAILAFIRSSDKAIAEYEAARLAADELNPSGPHSALLRTLDHFDSCITSCARCHRLLPVLKTSLRKPGVPKELRKQIEAFEQRFRETRNAIEHIEGELSGTVGDSTLLLSIAKTCDGLVVSAHTISFVELASILRIQRALSEVLADYAEHQD